MDIKTYWSNHHASYISMLGHWECRDEIESVDPKTFAVDYMVFCIFQCCNVAAGFNLGAKM